MWVREEVLFFSLFLCFVWYATRHFYTIDRSECHNIRCKLYGTTILDSGITKAMTVMYWKSRNQGMRATNANNQKECVADNEPYTNDYDADDRFSIRFQIRICQTQYTILQKGKSALTERQTERTITRLKHDNSFSHVYQFGTEACYKEWPTINRAMGCLRSRIL